LGIKNLEFFNLALLSKWKWRMLSDDDALWSDLPSLVLGGDPISHGPKESIWWKDIVGRSRGFVEDWFRPNMACNVGNGKNIGFWKFKWYENHSCKGLYPNFYVKEVV
jgi:hypothetical protein